MERMDVDRCAMSHDFTIAEKRANMVVGARENSFFFETTVM